MAKVIDEKGKVGRPSTKPVEKRKAYYVNVVVKNPHLGTVSNVLVSRDSKSEAMFLLEEEVLKAVIISDIGMGNRM